MKNVSKDIVEWAANLLPTNTSQGMRGLLRGELGKKLERMEETLIEDFCRQNNLCPICIKGGYNCTSSHK